MIAILLLSVATGLFGAVGVYLVTAGRFRRMTLLGYYTTHPQVPFNEVKMRRKAGEQLKYEMNQFDWMVEQLFRQRNLHSLAAHLDVMTEMAQIPLSGSLWLAKTLILRGGLTLILGLLMAYLSGIPAFALLPVVILTFSYFQLKQKAQIFRNRIQRQLPPTLALMASASDALTNLDGDNGIMGWTVRTINNEVSQLFRRFIVEAAARGVMLEDVMDYYANRWHILEFGLLAQQFALYHKYGRGLKDAFLEMANDWQVDQNQALEVSMGQRVFATTIPVVMFDIPALMMILLTPAAFMIFKNLHM